MKDLCKTMLVAGVIALASMSPVTAHAGADYKDAKAQKAQAIYPLAKEAGFKTLTAAIDAAGLAETLTDKGPFTVFAPTDEAFAALPKGTLQKLLDDPEALKQVLLYHVVAGKDMAADVVKMKSVKTLEGGSLAVAVSDDGVKVGGAGVVKTDIRASNGVIHVIDKVLVPTAE